MISLPGLSVIQQDCSRLALYRANYRENRQTSLRRESLWRIKRIAERCVEIATAVSKNKFAAYCNRLVSRETLFAFSGTHCVDKGPWMSKTLSWINGWFSSGNSFGAWYLEAPFLRMKLKIFQSTNKRKEPLGKS